jgi:hypothetical protein
MGLAPQVTYYGQEHMNLQIRHGEQPAPARYKAAPGCTGQYISTSSISICTQRRHSPRRMRFCSALNLLRKFPRQVTLWPLMDTYRVSMCSAAVLCYPRTIKAAILQIWAPESTLTPGTLVVVLEKGRKTNTVIRLARRRSPAL